MSAHATQLSRSEPRDVHENTNRILDLFFKQMIDLAGKNTDTSNAEAREIALMLITRPNLPLNCRFHAHIVLVCGKDDLLYHVQEALRIINMDRELFRLDVTLLTDVLNQFRESLRRTERILTELKRIEEGLVTGTIEKAKKGAELEGSKLGHSSISQLKIESPSVSKRKSKSKARSTPDDSEDEKNLVHEAEQVKIKTEINEAKETEVPQSEVEKSTRTKSKNKRKACSVSDDSGVENNVVDGKEYDSSRGRKASKLTITP